MPRQFEYPYSPIPDMDESKTSGEGIRPTIFDTSPAVYKHVPTNEYEAIMETPPGGVPRVSLAELNELREVLADALEALSPRDHWIATALFIEGKSCRRVAKELGFGSKTTITRLRDQIRARLAAALKDHPLVLAYFERSDTDDLEPDPLVAEPDPAELVRPAAGDVVHAPQR